MRLLFIIRPSRARIRVDWEILSSMLFTIGRRTSTVVASSFHVDFIEFIRAAAVVMIVKVSAAAGYVVVVMLMS